MSKLSSAALRIQQELSPTLHYLDGWLVSANPVTLLAQRVDLPTIQRIEPIGAITLDPPTPELKAHFGVVLRTAPNARFTGVGASAKRLRGFAEFSVASQTKDHPWGIDRATAAFRRPDSDYTYPRLEYHFDNRTDLLIRLQIACQYHGSKPPIFVNSGLLRKAMYFTSHSTGFTPDAAQEAALGQRMWIIWSPDKTRLGCVAGAVDKPVALP